MDEFNQFLPIAKLDKATQMVWGYASTPTKDLQGEIIPLDAIKAALPAYMVWANVREMHTSSAVGITKEANVDETGLYIGAKIVDPTAWAKCEEGVYKGFSIGGQKLEKVGNEVRKLNLLEISIVDRPANPDCKIDVVKIATDLPGVATEGVTLAGMMEKLFDIGKGLASMAKGDGFSAPARLDPRHYALSGNPPIVTDTGTTSGNTPNVIDLRGAHKDPESESRTFDDGMDKTVFTNEERTRLAGTGDALPDGSFPIRNKEDLHHAVEAFGRAKDKDKVKAHIKSRAHSLGALDILPDEWKDKKETGMTPEQMELQKRHSAEHMAKIAKAAGHIRKAVACHGKAMGCLAKCMGSMGKAATTEPERNAKADEITKHLTEMHGHMEDMAEHHEMAAHYLAGSGGSARGEGSVEGQANGTVTDKDREGLTVIPGVGGEADSVGTGTFATGSPYSAAAMSMVIENALNKALAPINDKLQKAEVENAGLKGQIDILKAQPANGRGTPRLFSVDASMLTPAAGGGTTTQEDEVNLAIVKAAGSIRDDDPDSALRASARIIGLRAMHPGMFGKSITDPSYKGGAAR